MLQKWIAPQAFSRSERDMFGNLLEDFFRPSQTLVPGWNVHDDGENFHITALLPGMKAEQVDVTTENNVLTVSGERTEEKMDDDTYFYRRERRSGKFSRSFPLPATIDADQVSAKLEDGVLTVTLPRAAEARARKIAVSEEE